MERQELGICARGLNSVMIGMYKQNMLGFMRAHNTVYMNLLRVRLFAFYGTPRSTYKATPVSVHEELGPLV